MKKHVWFFLFFLVVSAINITIFTISYNSLATPYLTEPQRVENASNILMITFPVFILSSLITIFLSVLLTKKLYCK